MPRVIVAEAVDQRGKHRGESRLGDSARQFGRVEARLDHLAKALAGPRVQAVVRNLGASGQGHAVIVRPSAHSLDHSVTHVDLLGGHNKY